MPAVQIFAIISTLLVGCVAILFSYRLERAREQLKSKNRELTRRLYELSISNEVADKIGYSLSIQGIIETIALTATRLFDSITTISYAFVDDSTITLKTYQRDFVGPHFMEAIRNITLEKVEQMTSEKKDYSVIETVQKDSLLSGNTYFDAFPVSYFTVPIIVNDAFMGTITLTSRAPHAFAQDDQALFSKIVASSEAAIGRLHDVIGTEEGKLDSFLLSLTTGAILLLIDGSDMRVTTINSAARNYLKLTETADTTMVLARFGMHYDLVKQIKEIVSQKKSMELKDVKIYEKYFKIFLNPVFLDKTEKIIGVSITMEDITLEKDIQQVRETFTNIMVHELRAPLTSIKGAASLLLGGKLKAEEHGRMLNIIKDSTERMLMDIGDILDVAKLEAGKFVLNKQMADLNKMITDKTLAFSFAAQEHHITINTKLDSKIPQFSFDPLRVGQVLNNLLSNAIKFTHDNGTITITTTLQNDHAQVIVADNGVGIAPEKIPLLFAKYEQVNNNMHAQGTGLGLYISKGIIDSHGGKIRIESEVGRGTQMIFSLPIVMEETAQVVPQTPLDAFKIAPKKIVN